LFWGKEMKGIESKEGKREEEKEEGPNILSYFLACYYEIAIVLSL
jgi:hypothetical protein